MNASHGSSIMSIKRTHNPGELDKRLKILNQQLYWKEKSTVVNRQTTDKKSSSTSLKIDYPVARATTDNSDVAYLKRDLMKITILAGLAFGVQFALYFAMINKLITLSF